jgi:hypothetical protein
MKVVDLHMLKLMLKIVPKSMIHSCKASIEQEENLLN